MDVSKLTSEATESLIKAVNTLYQQRGLLIPVRTLLLKFFSKIYQKEELRSYRIRYRSKVLSRWLAGLPLQLAHLGSRNPELSTQLIDIIHTAAARANKELLRSLQVTALRIYDPQEGAVVVLPAESQQLLVQLVYFLPSLPADVLSRLSHCCIMGRLSANLAAMLIGILHMRSSFSGWKSSVKEQNGSVQLNTSNADYFSFLFSTLTGFSKEELTWLQSLRGVPHVVQTPLSPVLLYLTDLDQFLHHWDVTETVCHNLLVVPVRSQSFDVLQTAVSKHLVGLTVIPDSTAGCVLGVICKLLDHTCVLSETLLPFLASCCYSLLYFLLTLEKGEAEHLRKRKRGDIRKIPVIQVGGCQSMELLQLDTLGVPVRTPSLPPTRGLVVRTPQEQTEDMQAALLGSLLSAQDLISPGVWEKLEYHLAKRPENSTRHKHGHQCLLPGVLEGTDGQEGVMEQMIHAFNECLPFA
ncbi:hypothetical protein ABFV05_006851 [Capra hircus]